MKIRKSIAALSLAIVAPLTLVACGSDDTDSSSTAATTSSPTTSSATSGSSDTSGTTTDGSAQGGMAAPAGDEAPAGGGGPGGVDVDSVTTVDQLVEMIQSAYGEASLGLHRGHQPVEDVLTEVLKISHDELHVRMEEQGQNLAAVAEDLGIDPQTLIDAMVAKYSPAIDNLLAAGTISSDEADAYLDALEEAFTFRVTWDGEEATPTFRGI